MGAPCCPWVGRHTTRAWAMGIGSSTCTVTSLPGKPKTKERMGRFPGGHGLAPQGRNASGRPGLETSAQCATAHAMDRERMVGCQSFVPDAQQTAHASKAKRGERQPSVRPSLLLTRFRHHATNTPMWLWAPASLAFSSSTDWPCLLPPKIFQILRHIESLDVYIEY